MNIQLYFGEQHRDMSADIARIANKHNVKVEDVMYALYIIGKGVVSAKLKRDKKK